jgi:group II intron reverse transcriptase/maturase
VKTLHRPQKTTKDGYLQRDRLETEEYVEACSNVSTEMGRQDGTHLIDKVIEDDNLYKAYKRVRAKKGSPGVDGITFYQLYGHMQKYYKPLKRKLKDGSYQPQPVKRVEIPKNDGTKDKRKLGIPTVLDRVVQQAIYQVIVPLIDPHFSDHSYGFRPKRNAQQAIKKSANYYEQGYRIAVDCDLKSYFDTIHHQKLMEYLKVFIKDEVVLKLIWKFLKSGILDGDTFTASESGAPQGGNLSPLLSNVYLNQLDRELEKRGHKFVRYADDFCIYVKSERAGHRLLDSITKFLEKDLKLTVNRNKSNVGPPTKLKFLGYCIHRTSKEVRCRPYISAKKKFKAKLKAATKRNRPGTFTDIVKEINQITVGWINYYGISFMRKFVKSTAEWLNHRLRQLIWKRWKKIKTRFAKLKNLGINKEEAWKFANSRKGYWRLSSSETLHKAIKKETLINWGLKDLNQLYERKYSSY